MEKLPLRKIGTFGALALGIVVVLLSLTAYDKHPLVALWAGSAVLVFVLSLFAFVKPRVSGMAIVAVGALGIAISIFALATYSGSANRVQEKRWNADGSLSSAETPERASELDKAQEAKFKPPIYPNLLFQLLFVGCGLAISFATAKGKSNGSTAPVSAVAKDEAEELRKMKKLFDDGVISQEEFEAKKKKLLGV